MSDKFEAPGRNFGDGYNIHWTEIHKNDYTNNAQQFYSSDNYYTNNDGDLVILTQAANTGIIGFD